MTEEGDATAKGQFSKANSLSRWHNGERLLNEKLTLAGCGTISEVNNLCAECDSILPSKNGGSGLRRTRRSTRNVAAGVALHSSGASQKESGHRLQCPNSASCVQCRKVGYWESFKEDFREKKGKISEWTFERLQEAYDKVASEDIDRLSIGQEILKKSTDFLRRIIAPVDGMGGATLSYVCPHCNWFPLEDYIWWVSSGHRKKQCSRWFAACGGQYD